MERRSLLEYFDNFLRLGRESAYIQRRGYRSVRWTYRQVAETAFQFARELAKRGIGKALRGYDCDGNRSAPSSDAGVDP